MFRITSNTYKVFVKEEGPVKDVKVTKDVECNLWAALFGVFYYLYKRLWIESLGIVVASFILIGFETSIQSPIVSALLNMGFAIALGCLFPQLEESRLLKNGFQFKEKIESIKKGDDIRAEYIARLLTEEKPTT